MRHARAAGWSQRAIACAVLIALLAARAYARADARALATLAPAPATHATQSASTETPPKPWLFVSDVHFDPFDDPALVGDLLRAPVDQWHAILMRGSVEPSGYFRDTNFALLESALGAMRAAAAPPVVAIAGDFLAHDFGRAFARAAPGRSQATYERFVDTTVAFLAREFDTAFPAAQFVIALGNNDGYCGDYRSTPHSAFLAHMAAAWEPLVNRGGNAAAFEREFSDAGYYTATLPGTPRGEAIVLNSVVWSAKYQNACGDATTDPGKAELDWLRATVTARPVSYRWIVTHIPPGIDAYASLRAGAPVAFMHESYARRLVALAAAPDVCATLFLTGHIHHYSFYVVGPGDGSGVPGLVVPSVSPIQGNNPAFVRAEVGSDGTLLSMSVYAALASGWQREPSTGIETAGESFSTVNLAGLQTLLKTDPSTRAAFYAAYNAQSSTAAIVPATWPWYWCADTQLTAPAYGRCLQATLLRADPASPGPAGLPSARSAE